MKQYLIDNTWVWAGTALVLITLSGATLRMALIVTSVATVLHLAFSLMSNGDDK